MTERICLVGNSHLIMMQKAWAEQDPASDSVEAVFFGALIRHYRDLHRDAERSVLTFSGDLAPHSGQVRPRPVSPTGRMASNCCSHFLHLNS